MFIENNTRKDPAIAINKQYHLNHRQYLRRRFLKVGSGGISNYEMLELILFSAKPTGDVKPIAKSLINKFGSFSKVFLANPSELLKVNGVDEAVLAAIKVTRSAVEELLYNEFSCREIIKCWTQLIDYLRLHIGHNQNEVFHVLFLNTKLELIADEELQRGTINYTPIYPREVLKRALELGASSIILVHNHPCGDVSPSEEDIAVTKLIIDAIKPLGIKVCDHVIIGPNSHFSFKANGII